MNRNILYLLIGLLAERSLISQTLPVSGGGCSLFKQHIYAYGFSAGAKPEFCVYKLNAGLQKTDSVFIPLDASKPEDYLLVYADTLHDYLNIYLQLKATRQVNILRFNQHFKLLANITKVEVARLNSSDMFGGNFHYYKNNVYAIKTQRDSSGLQYYLNKYNLKSETANFDYELSWQFPFERKQVGQARVIYANPLFVWLYVAIRGGAKQGNWVLKLNAQSGKLIKGSKLNAKDETAHYLPGALMADQGNKTLHLTGQKLSATQLNYEKNQLNSDNTALASLYYVCLDSLGEVIQRQEFKVPVVDLKTGPKKTNSTYLVKPLTLQKRTDGSFVFETDIYKSTGEALCYRYCNSNLFVMTPQDEQLVLQKNSIAPNPEVDAYFSSADPLDLNGKLCADSVSNFADLYFAKPTLPVKLFFKLDEFLNPYWILTKSNLKKGLINYSSLLPVKKKYELKSLADISKQLHPGFFRLSQTTCLISQQTEGGQLLLKLLSW